MQYEKTIIDFSGADLISVPDAELEKYSTVKSKMFPNASYIWPYGCVRFHMFRLFTLKAKIVRAEAEFVCDNLFDVWLNGENLASDVRYFTSNELSKFLTDGENNLHIRAYQSDSDERFSSAITGGIRIYYENGEIEEILTDGEFKQVLLIDFGENEEPAGFETETHGRVVAAVNVMKLHPIALRRSFYFVRDFFVGRELKSAVLYSSALGSYEPYINGKRIDDVFFIPFCQNYEKECQKFDVTNLLKQGKNRIGAILGNGTYNCSSWGNMRADKPQFTAFLKLTYTDGESECIFTDENWRCMPSPLTDNDIQYGERYDARLEIEGWCDAETKNENEKNVCLGKSDKTEKLLLQSYPFIRKMKCHTLKNPVKLTDGSYMWDVGECIAGRAGAVFKNLEAGQKIKIRYYERLDKSTGLPLAGAYGTVYYPVDCEPGGRSTAFMRNTDVYFAAGRETESYECRFAYTGFRYVCVEGIKSLSELSELYAFELHNDLKMTGHVITENEAVKKIFGATKRAWLNNIFNGPTDCPTREKNFWNGDMQIFSGTACWLTDNASFLSRWTDNGIKMHPGPYAWEDETYILPLTLYRFYGDKEILRRRFPEMLKLIEKRCEYDGMVLPSGKTREYCDWLSPTGITPDKPFFCGCWYYYMLKCTSQIAEIIGEIEKAKELSEKAERARAEFNEKFFLADEHDYTPKNQCGIVLPLAFGIAPENERESLSKTLVGYVEKADYHLTTGFIGTRYLFPVLSDFGYGDVAYKILSQKDFPSWLDMLSSGATSMTESWEGENSKSKGMSMSHFSLGSVTEWFFEYLGGIRLEKSAPGLSRVYIEPLMLKEIGSFEMKYMTERGEIVVEWHFDGDEPVLNYSVPEGITVEVSVRK